MPADLKEQAAREIFDKIELDGPHVVAVYPREEHAWLLGMHAKRQGLLGMVGARGFNPASTKCRIVLPGRVLTAILAA